jgi:putative membrane protein insertion efficiency factor
MAKNSNPVGTLMRGLIRAYQLLISPWLGPRCRFYPSCSAYALEALEQHGLARGAILALYRLGRCHPGCAGGYDPVPVRTIRCPSLEQAPDLHDR